MTTASRYMRLNECRTTAERDALVTVRRYLRRKGMTWFAAVGLGLAEELKYGSHIGPNFVERISDGTRMIDERGMLALTKKGYAALREEAGIGDLSTVESLWHYWTETNEYIRSGCGLIRKGGTAGQQVPPADESVCAECAYVAEHGHARPVVIEVQS